MNFVLFFIGGALLGSSLRFLDTFHYDPVPDESPIDWKLAVAGLIMMFVSTLLT